MSRTRPEGPYDANLIVIGAGSAGLVSAYIATAVKARIILIEKGRMGGDCLNTGCVPSKALIRSARFLHQLGRAEEFGIDKVSPEFDFAAIMQRVQRVIGEVAPHDSVERYTGLGAEVIEGEARLLSPHSVEVNGRILTARGIIIAAGARPFIPPIEGIDEIDHLTSDNIWTLRELPERLLVLGGGPIGCELAQCFARFGSKVTIVEMLPRIMIREDEEISALVAEQFQKENIDLRTRHKAVRFISVDGKKTLVCDHAGETVEIPFDHVLVAVGRTANLEGYGLHELEIPISKRRTIEVNDYLQAGYPTLYACGDVAGPYQFTHAASHQAWYATVNALFGGLRKFKVDYSVIPWATFTDPEVARVGLNEQEAK
ncbi:MAG: FAD-dependent oxidoreductase, partial [Pseudomonadota bacterium]|nr:FAD-dependent oxidoreductase [Pseudomonadota bacterium]